MCVYVCVGGGREKREGDTREKEKAGIGGGRRGREVEFERETSGKSREGRDS